MSSGFHHDVATARQQLEAARAAVLDAITGFTDDALDRARRGGWSVRRVLQHVNDSEWHYARLVTQLRGLPVPTPPAGQDMPPSMPEAVRRLSASHQALLAALEGIDEESFYRLGPGDREEYSVLSVLENAAHHDREHAQQMGSITATQ